MQKLLGGTIFDSSAREKTVYLTFDDGPSPESTPEILEILKKFKAKATFFCSGKNVKKHPELYKLIRELGHSTGNHGFEHLNGFRNKASAYIRDAEKATEFIRSDIFRPPYGKLLPGQIKLLKKRYSIIYWDLLFADYRQDFDPIKTFAKAKKHLKPGRVFVLHDNPANLKNTKVLLTLVLEYLKENNLISSKISNGEI
jgi:peptidoglycan-N-acetylglucosamine deacetylase